MATLSAPANNYSTGAMPSTSFATPVHVVSSVLPYLGYSEDVILYPTGTPDSQMEPFWS